MRLLELVHWLDCTSCNTSIIAIILVLVELQHYLPNGNNVLVDTKFVNVT